MSNCFCHLYKNKYDLYNARYKLLAYDVDGPFIYYIDPCLIFINSEYKRYKCAKCGYNVRFYLVCMGNNRYNCMYESQHWGLRTYIHQGLIKLSYYRNFDRFVTIPELGNAFSTDEVLIYFDVPIVKICFDTCILADGTLARCFYNKNDKIIAINQNGEEVSYSLLNKTSANMFENDKYSVVIENFDSSYSTEFQCIFINKANGKYTKAAAK
jgi:hypothetical protein